MKKIIFLVFVFAPLIFATESQYFMGLEYSKYGFVGVERDNKWGVAIENSFFVEYLEFQYVRLNVFYRFNLPFDVRGSYVLYMGMRYNRDYLDVGGVLYLQRGFWGDRISIRGAFQPSYDSDIKQQIGYLGEGRVRVLSDVGLVVGVKNIAEYRENEQRLYGGLFFDTPHMLVRPEISIPTNMKMSVTRVSVSFLYKNVI